MSKSLANRGVRYPFPGFTLIEMLVAMAVLFLIIVLFAQMMSSTARITNAGMALGESDNVSRTILNILENDFKKIVRRSDVDYVFTKQKGNDEFFFFSEAPGASSSRDGTVTLVGYRFDSNCSLNRLGKGLGWTKTEETPNVMVYLPNTLASTWAVTASGASTDADSDFHPITRDIFRLEFCFMDNKGTYFQPTAAWTPDALKNVNAIVVAVACIDKAGRQIAGTAGLQRLANALADPRDSDLTGTPPILMADTWQKQIALPKQLAIAANVPLPVVQNIHVYQRVIWFNH